MIVNYNYARYLPDAVQSVLGQNVPFDEVVVVDDGSTDDSLEVLLPYRNRVTVLEIPNGGQLGACRAGLAAVDSDYVYFLDADDYAHPGLVETVAGELADRPVKVQFQLEGVSLAVERLQSVFPVFPQEYDAARMQVDNRSLGFYVCPPTSGNLYRRSSLLGLPLDTLDQRDFIDGPATLALPYCGEIRSVNVALASYRVHGGNHSQWSEPTIELLSGEMEWFVRRWRQTAALLGTAGPPFGDRTPLYLLERELMIGALGGHARILPLVAGMLQTLPATNLPPRHKIALTGWAIALCLPVARARRALVRARRSPLNRSPWLRTIVRLLLRGRPGRGRTP